MDLVISKSATAGLNERQMTALGFGRTVPSTYPAEDFRLSRDRNVDSLHFFSDGFLIKTLMHRQVRRLRGLVPRAVKQWARKVTGTASSTKHFKKLSGTTGVKKVN